MIFLCRHVGKAARCLHSMSLMMFESLVTHPLRRRIPMLARFCFGAGTKEINTYFRRLAGNRTIRARHTTSTLSLKGINTKSDCYKVPR